MIRIQQQQKQGQPGDTNGDGVVDDQDTAAAEAVPGDTNGDGVVDDQDTAAAEAVPGDTNGDGVVDDQDTAATTDTTGTGTTTAQKQPTVTDLEELITTPEKSIRPKSTNNISPKSTNNRLKHQQSTKHQQQLQIKKHQQQLQIKKHQQHSAQKAPTTAPDQKAPTTSAQKAPTTATKVDTKDQLSKQKIPCNPSEQLVKNGSSGNAVKILQTILTQMGYDPKAVDGKFGPNTEKAVIQFQEKNGLVKRWKVGKNTWAKLCALYKEKNTTTTLEDLIDGGDKAGGGVMPVRENEVCKITKLDLKLEDIGDDIVILQKNLKELGYYP